MLGVFAALAAFFFLAERLTPLHKDQPVLRTGFLVDAAYVVIHYFMRVFLNVTVVAAASGMAARLFPEWSLNVLRPQPAWMQAVVLLLVLDLVFYVTHRLKHRWQWWWRLHETHHSSTVLDWFASVRFHPLEKILDRSIFLLPLLVIGPSEQAVLVWSAVDVFFGMFGHSNVRWRLGPLKYLFVGPEMHRWHHALDPQRNGCNFGNNFAIFDWLFGTAYVAEDTPSAFGVQDPDYPTTNIFKQWVYAFRALPRETTAWERAQRLGA
jgi:sterol desaturase/sphingolipid hydroxylase (fatty acid hydroxylase superfamily)